MWISIRVEIKKQKLERKNDREERESKKLRKIRLI